MPKLLTLLALCLLSLLSVTTATRAEDCPFQAGDRVLSTLDDKHYVILEVSAYNCLVDYRSVDASEQPFDPYISGMMGDFLVPWDGPVDITNDYGCPWQPGDSADYQAAEGAWRPATITASDKTCRYSIDYYDNGLANPAQVNPHDANDVLRVATLQPPTADEMATAKLCPPGGAAEDYATADRGEELLKRAMIADLSDTRKTPIHLFVDSFRYGETLVLQRGDAFLRDHPETAVGGEVYPIRVRASVCDQSSGRPVMTTHLYDYNCYFDKFGDFACRQEAER